jgi:hypothetical protein
LRTPNRPKPIVIDLSRNQFWAETSKLFTGEVTFLDSSDVMIDLQGNPDEAGFGQVIRGRASDPARVRELMTQDSEEWASFRPDILGSVSVSSGDAYTAVIYCTSEAEARAGEKKKMPERMKAQMEEMNSLEVGEPTSKVLRCVRRGRPRGSGAP